MNPFQQHTGKVVAYDMPNVDTDQIIPARFLKKIDRVGFGELLFHDLRFEIDGTPKPGFILDEPRYAGATILASGPQFGIGSSREHAPWAIQQFGFKAVIAPSFGDIFRNNCYQNGLLPVQLKDDEVSTIIASSQEIENYQLSVDLETQTVTDSLGLSATFEIEAFRKDTLLRGLDDIGLTLEHEDDISQFERARA
jgi:3-isopropylmalate/(R)-2-methylmalate dehydratase small subunit